MGDWRFINSVVLDSDGKTDINADHNGNPFGVNEVLIHCKIQSVSGTNFIMYLEDDENNRSGINLIGFMSESVLKEFCVHVKYEKIESGGKIRFIKASGYNIGSSNLINAAYEATSTKIENLFKKIARIYTDVKLKSGSEIDIYGR